MKKLRLFLSDDHPMFLDGLTTVLTLKDPDIEIVGTAGDGEETLQKVKRCGADVLLLDIKMPVLDGIETVKRIREDDKNLIIFMLTTFNNREYIDQACDAGANGYLLKDTPPDQIIQAIRSEVMI